MGYFSDQEMNRRLANLRHAMDNQSVEAVLITSVHNTLYYSNFWMIPWGREQGLVIQERMNPPRLHPILNTTGLPKWSVMAAISGTSGSTLTMPVQ